MLRLRRQRQEEQLGDCGPDPNVSMAHSAGDDGVMNWSNSGDILAGKM